MPYYTFNCLFTGLCGFVLNKPLELFPDAARVLLPEGDKAASTEGLSIHRPVLVIPTKNIRAVVGRFPDFIVQIRGKESVSIYMLNGTDLSFNFNNEGIPADLDINSTLVQDYEKPNEDEKKSFRMIGSLERGAPDAKAVDATCLTDVPNGERVGARVRLQSGKLFVRSIYQIYDDSIKAMVDEVWEFVKEPIEQDQKEEVIWSQVFAEDVVLEKQQMSSGVELIGKSHINDRLSFRIVIGPIDREAVVEVEVVNSEWDALCGLKSYVSPEAGEQARDIKLTYKLSTAWDGVSGTEGLPILRRKKGGAGRPIHCPRLSFIYNEDA